MNRLDNPTPPHTGPAAPDPAQLADVYGPRFATATTVDVDTDTYDHGVWERATHTYLVIGGASALGDIVDTIAATGAVMADGHAAPTGWALEHTSLDVLWQHGIVAVDRSFPGAEPYDGVSRWHTLTHPPTRPSTRTESSI